MAGNTDTNVRGAADVNIHHEATLCMWVRSEFVQLRNNLSVIGISPNWMA